MSARMWNGRLLIFVIIFVVLPSAVLSAGYLDGIELSPLGAAFAAGLTAAGLCIAVCVAFEKYLLAEWVGKSSAALMTAVLTITTGWLVYRAESDRGAVLAAPIPLVAKPTTTGVTLQWRELLDPRVTGYVVRRDGARLHEANVTVYTDNTVQPGQTYTYQVNAVGAGAESAPATAQVEVPSESLTLRPPRGLTAVASANSVQLAWEAGEAQPAGMGYAINRDGAALGTTENLTYVDTGLLPDVVYTYTVQVHDPVENAQSAPSQPLTIRTLAGSGQKPPVVVAPPPPGGQSPPPPTTAGPQAAFVTIEPSSGTATTAFRITGRTPAHTYPLPLWVNMNWQFGTDSIQIPLNADFTFGPIYLSNSGQGHDGQIQTNDSGLHTLTPGSYPITFTFCCAKPGFSIVKTLTISP